MSEYYEGICGDGVAILKDGELMTISEILMDLDNAESLRQQLAEAQNKIEVAYSRGWSDRADLAEARAGRVPDYRMADGAPLLEYLTNVAPADTPMDDWTAGYEECKRRLYRILAPQVQPQPPAGVVTAECEHFFGPDGCIECGKKPSQLDHKQ